MENKRAVTPVYKLCLCAIMAALYFVFTYFLTIRIGNVRITLASLPIVLLSVFYGAGWGGIAALLGEFLNQMLLYGFTATTVLWLLPPVLRAVVVALGCKLLRRRDPTHEPWEKPLPYGAVLLLAALITTGANTLVMWLDSLIFHYPAAYVLGELAVRLVTSILTAIVVTLISIPLLSSLKKVTGHAAIGTKSKKSHS